MWNGSCDNYRAQIESTCIEWKKVQEDEEGEENVQEEACIWPCF